MAFTGHTYTPEEGDPGPIGWFATRDGSATSGQINRAQDIYPVNDHPSDKATYSYTIAAPKATTVAVSGRRTGKRAVGDTYVWSFEMDEPMASQVIQVATGDLVEVERGRVGGTRLRDVVARSYVGITNPTLSKGPAQFRWMLGHAGAYPFDEYGVLAVDQFMQYALETQTLTLHPAELFDPAVYPQEFAESIAVHELAHQWFGDSVAIEEYSDLWLAEGPATWYEHEFNADFYGEDFEAFMREQYSFSQEYRDTYGPVARPKNGSDEVIFSDQIYGGGALALFALHEKVGDRTWRALDEGVGAALRGPVGLHRRLHRLRGPQRPRRPDALPARLAVRHEDPADARSPGLGGRGSGRHCVGRAHVVGRAQLRALKAVRRAALAGGPPCFTASRSRSRGSPSPRPATGRSRTPRGRGARCTSGRRPAPRTPSSSRSGSRSWG